MFLKQIKNPHHWLCRKLEDEKISNTKCQCSKGFTNRFGLHTSASRTIISCSWCKKAIHSKCYHDSNRSEDCSFGEHNDLIIPPNWIIKLARKNVISLSLSFSPLDPFINFDYFLVNKKCKYSNI